MRRTISSYLTLSLVLFCSTAQAQLRVVDGTSVTIDPGTTLSVLSPNDTVHLEINTVVVNDGVIEFGAASTLDEQDGFPITGLGYEMTTRDFTGALTTENVAGLGFVITTSLNLGMTTLYRGHTQEVNGVDLSVMRWYDVVPANNTALSADLIFNYDQTELASLSESMLVLFNSDDGGATWNPLAASTLDQVANEVSVTTLDSLNRFTAFEFILSVGEAEKGIGFRVFPNPAVAGEQTYAMIMNETHEDFVITLTTLDGKQLLANSYSANTQMVEIPLNDLTPGVYFIDLLTETHRATQRLLVR